MKYLIRLFFVLIPIIVSCQYNKTKEITVPTTTRPGDSINFPSLDSDWTGIEFQQVMSSIIEKQENADFQSPALNNGYKNLFIKLTNFENYGFLKSKNVKFIEKANYTENIIHLVTKLFLNYRQKSKLVAGKLSNEAEITSLHNLLLKLTEYEVELSEEFVQSNPNLTQIQLEGQKRMIRGMSEMVAGDLYIIENEYKDYSDSCICSQCSAFAEFYAYMRSRIDNDDRIKYDEKIKDLASAHKRDCIGEILRKNQ